MNKHGNGAISGMATRTRFLALLLLATASVTASAQQQHARITQPADGQHMRVLKGNVHPLARPENDRGVVEAALPMDRMMLVLRHSDEQEAALKQLIDQQQDAHSSNFHQWLTPQQYAEKFGPADQDIATVSTWLQSQGFHGIHVNAGHTTLEFSGDAAKVNRAFRTSIHHYRVQGRNFTANATDPAIPEALTPVVASIASLNNFPDKPQAHKIGKFRRDLTTGHSIRIATADGTPVAQDPRPLFTDTVNGFYGLGPTDIATIYNTLPLWNASTPINGTGQTIAIVGAADIYPADFVRFRQMFGLPLGDTTGPTGTQYLNIIRPGPAPGFASVGTENENDLDTQWAAAVAPGAVIDFVTSASTSATQGTDLSLEYIVDNNLAPVMNLSYGVCELGFGYLGRGALYNSLYQQAAAQGITVVVAAGDSGSGGCDINGTNAQYGLEVNGIASSPYDVAVGGTDFVLDNGTYFSTTNNPTTGASALSYIPERVWNDSCGSPYLGLSAPFTGSTPEQVCNSTQPDAAFYRNLVAGGGGASNCTTGDGFHANTCAGGYAKPGWQSGPGVPADGARDVPDVSFFAGDGLSYVFYIFCTENATCDLNSGNDFFGAGGTSIASPVFAGVMALVNQKTGQRQGNPNYTLYKLASMQSASGCNSSNGSGSSCIFNDITYGSNAVPCLTGALNCITQTTGDTYGLLSGYSATAGYDLASGLGSINITNLVNGWSTAAFNSTTTTLGLTPTTITHGASVAATVSVTGTGGTPTGDYSILAAAPLEAVAHGTLSSGSASPTITTLPGGSYNVTAHYAGDTTFAASDSAPVPVTVTPESSLMTLSIYKYDNLFGTSTTFTSAPYGSMLHILMNAAGFSGQGIPTGTFALTSNGSAFSGSPFTIYALDPTNEVDIASLPLGSYSFAASYSGDNSFNASSSSTTSFSIVQRPTTTTITPGSATIPPGGSQTLSVFIDTDYSNTAAGSQGAALTGTATLTLGGNTIGTGSVSATTDGHGFQAGSASINVSGSQLALGFNLLTVTYSGDTNYESSNNTTQITTAKATSAISLSVPSTAVVGDNVTFTATVTPTSPPATGTVQFTIDGANAGSPVTVGSGTAHYSLTTLATGAHTIGATYSGNTSYLGATATTQSITVLSAQTITFPQPASPVGFGVTASEALTATSSSGLAVSYSVAGPATLSGSTVSFTGTGTVTVTASQAGNSQYAAATPVAVTILVEMGQAISFSALPGAVVFGQTPTSTLTATGGASGNPVTFSATGPATISGTTLTYTGAGTVVVTANQAGNGTYAAALPVSHTVTVLPPQANYVFSSTLNVASASQGVVFNFTVATTLSTTNAVQVVTNGVANLDFTLDATQPSTGACANGAAFNAADSCTVNVIFTPQGMNQRNGAVVLRNSSGTVIATAYLSGAVSGPLGVFTAGVATSFGSISAAIGISLDSAGNAYVSNGNSTSGVVQIPASCTTTTCTQNTVSPSISLPYSPVIDGAGNIYVSDYGHGRYVIVPVGCSTTCTPTVIGGSGLINGKAVIVDNAGNVYAMNNFNGSTTNDASVNLVEMPASCLTCTAHVVIAGDFNSPVDMAADIFGNIYVADKGHNRIVEVPAGCTATSCEVILASSNAQLVSPVGVAIDSAGNLYVSATTSLGSGILYELPAGCIMTANSTCQITLATGSIASSISGVAIDGSGNIIATANQSKTTLQKFDRTQTAALTFPTTGIGGTSATQTVSFQNTGNQDLNFSSITVPSGFTLTGGTCSTASALTAGSVCTFGITFTPAASSVNSGALTITDNNTGTPGSVQSVSISGTASSLYGTSISLSASPNTGLVVGHSTVLTAFLSPTSAGGHTPTGTITFSDAGTVLCSAVAFNTSGVATCNATLPAAGSRTLSAVYTGDANFMTSTGTTAVTVAAGSQTITFPQPVSPVVYFAGASTQTLTATASSGLAITYTVNSGPATISGSALTYTGTGTVVVTASQAGNANYAAATPVSVTIVVVTPQTAYTFPAASIGTPATQTITARFYSTLTLNATAATAVQVRTDGAPNLDYALSGTQPSSGACTAGATYNAGDTCTLNITFTPIYPGQRKGAVVLYDNSATPVVAATVYMSGTGNGALGTFTPGVQTKVLAAVDPGALAVDGAGNLYFANAAFGGTAVKIPSTCNNTCSQQMIATNISTSRQSSYGGALDAAGNFYVSDTGNNRALVIPYGCISNSCQTALGTNLNFPVGIAVDGAGKAYIADSNNDQVISIPHNGVQTTVASALFFPYGVALDPSGALYVAGVYTNNVLKIPAGCTTTPCRQTIGNVSNYVQFISSDNMGNIYLPSSFTTPVHITEIASGCSTITCGQVTFGSGLSSPYGTATDAGGNFYIGDTTALYKVDRTTSALTFASTAVGASAAEQTVTFQNNGNQTLNIASITSSSSSYTIGPSTTCGATLAINATCVIGVVFSPVAVGTLTGTINITDNNYTGSNSVQQISFTGSAPKVITTLTLATPSPASPGVGQTTLLTATVSPSTAAGTAATGTITFKDGAAIICNTVTISSGVATCTTPTLTAGSHSFTASYTGDTTFNSSTSNTQTLSALTAQTITFAQPASIVYGAVSAVTLGATASSALSVVYTISGPATVSGSTLTITGPGLVLISATQAGNSTFAAASAVTRTLSVAAPVANATLASGTQSATPVTITLAFANGFTLGSITTATIGTTGNDFTVVSGASAGTCSIGTPYLAGQSCTVKILITPTTPNLITGTVNMLDTSSTVQATAILVSLRYR